MNIHEQDAKAALRGMAWLWHFRAVMENFRRSLLGGLILIGNFGYAQADDDMGYCTRLLGGTQIVQSESVFGLQDWLARHQLELDENNCIRGIEEAQSLAAEKMALLRQDFGISACYRESMWAPPPALPWRRIEFISERPEYGNLSLEVVETKRLLKMRPKDLELLLIKIHLAFLEIEVLKKMGIVVDHIPYYVSSGESPIHVERVQAGQLPLVELIDQTIRTRSDVAVVRMVSRDRVHRSSEFLCPGVMGSMEESTELKSVINLEVGWIYDPSDGPDDGLETLIHELEHANSLRDKDLGRLIEFRSSEEVPLFPGGTIEKTSPYQQFFRSDEYEAWAVTSKLKLRQWKRSHNRQRTEAFFKRQREIIQMILRDRDREFKMQTDLDRFCLSVPYGGDEIDICVRRFDRSMPASIKEHVLTILKSRLVELENKHLIHTNAD